MHKRAASAKDRGRYTIIRTLEKGGLGNVYLVRDNHLDRLVVLKTPSIVNEVNLKRFRREAKHLGRVKHDNIVELTDAGEDAGLALGIGYNGLPYYTAEYLIGDTLDQISPIFRYFSLDQILDMGLQVAHGLSALHEKNLVHRDVKLENIFLIIMRNGAFIIKLFDFGYVLDLNDASQIEEASRLAIGTPGCMAIEQFTVDMPVDQRADIHALGVVLYELLLRATPYIGSEYFDVGEWTRDSMQEVWDTQLHAVIPPFSLIRPDHDIPRELEDVVQKALHKHPDDRQQTIGQVIDELEHCRRILHGA